MKKVGILSMQRINNYGSYLQSWSLRNILLQLECDVVFVDYHIERCCKKNNNLLDKAKGEIYCFKRNIYSNVRNYCWKTLFGLGLVKEPHFKADPRFQNAWEDIGIDPVKKYRTKVDLLIIGSDEVFNCLQANREVGFSKELFGYRNRAKHVITYAASFGNTTHDRLIEYRIVDKVRKLLKRIEDFSMRDENSCNTIKSLCGIEPICHLDPVLIGDFSEFPDVKPDVDNYLLVYGYGNRFSEEEQYKINAFAKERKLVTVSIGGKQDFCEYHFDCTPYEVFSYFKYADYVVTDTFHGSIFSIVTHVPFATFIRSSKGDAYGNEEKLNDLLHRLKMEDRIVLDTNNLPNVLCTPISFAISDSIRANGRREAIEYLKNHL